MEVLGIDKMKEIKPWIDNNTEDELAIYRALRIPADQHLEFNNLPLEPKPTLLNNN